MTTHKQSHGKIPEIGQLPNRPSFPKPEAATLERVTLDGTKIKANAGGNTFRRQPTIEAHLQLAREQVRLTEEQAAAEEPMARRQVAARRRAARQRRSRLEAAGREVERLQREKKDDRDSFVARASSTDKKALAEDYSGEAHHCDRASENLRHLPHSNGATCPGFG